MIDTKKLDKWAKEIHGNAIVPQVMYEIFRAIEIAETQPHPAHQPH